MDRRTLREVRARRSRRIATRIRSRSIGDVLHAASHPSIVHSSSHGSKEDAMRGFADVGIEQRGTDVDTACRRLELPEPPRVMEDAGVNAGGIAAISNAWRNVRCVS